MTETSTKRPKWVSIALVVLPLWLITSAFFAVWFNLHQKEALAAKEQQRFVKMVSAPMIADDLKKIIEIIGERNTSSETAINNLHRMAAMIDGVLGPSNIGYAIQRTPTSMGHPIIHVTLNSKQTHPPHIWIVTSYDSAQGTVGAEANASGVAATLAAAQAMADDSLPGTIHFAFIPHLNDSESPILETANQFRDLAKNASSVICVEAMGADSPLWISSRDSSAPPLTLSDQLGTVKGAETICLSDDNDLSSILFEMNLSAVRVATRHIVSPTENDTVIPSAANVAASAGRLIDFIRRCARVIKSS